MGAKEAAAAFAAGGAAGMSILTEKRYFQGTLAFLERARWANLPLLRKDFLFDPLQIEETAATPASAVLLIARYFVDDPDKLKSMALMAKQFKLETVVEIFSPVELELARESGPDIIQVNNRDLDSLEVDLSRSRDLADLKAEDEVWISASGISAPNQVQGLGAQGYDGVLVGTWLMRQANLEAALCYLRGTGDQLKNRGSQRWAY
jgi:indole-3-glycerol phosphate synthase